MQASDWYSVSRQTFVELGGATLVHKEGSLAKVLSSVYPGETWYPELFRTEEPSGENSFTSSILT